MGHKKTRLNAQTGSNILNLITTSSARLSTSMRMMVM